MIDHLVMSTLVLALAILAARLLPLTARTRHALLLCGLAKFAIPEIGIRKIEVVAMPPRVFDGTLNAVAPAAEGSIEWLPIVWATVAALLFGRWLLLRTRTVAAALRSPAPASQRELDALAEARRILGIRTAVDIVRSPICEAPAVLRVVRPVIVLPARGCDDLTDDELHALLLHELAHVARRDNLVALFTSLAGALLWFHPLVWVALRRLDTTREQSCDERVAEAMNDTDSYLEALTKVCRAVIAPRTAGAACMAGANVKERIEHLMNYTTIKSKAWSHRGVLAVSLLMAVAAAAVAAVPQANEQAYDLRVKTTTAADSVKYNVYIVENGTSRTIESRGIQARPNEDVTYVSGEKTQAGEVEFRVVARADAKGTGTARLEVRRDGRMVQNSVHEVQPPDPKYSGEPISMDLKNADLRDVLRTFGDITGLKFEVAPGIEATVTIHLTDVPWDQALDIIARQTGTKIVIDGKTVRVTR